MGVLRHGLGHNKQVGTKRHCLGSNICPNKLIFCRQVEEKKYIPSSFLEKIILITRIRRKSDFRVWQLSTLVPIKILVSSLTEMHIPCQTVSKEQPLFKSVTRLNPALYGSTVQGTNSTFRSYSFTLNTVSCYFATHFYKKKIQ